MKTNDELTNEGLSSLFADNFQLAFYSIRLARNEIKAGHETSMQKVLKEVKKNPQLYAFQDHLLDQSHLS